MSIASEVLASARTTYDIAERVYWNERERGGIVELDRTDHKDNENWLAGQRWKCVTPEALKAMGYWQKAKAELDAASVALKMERGFVGCPICPQEGPGEPVPAREQPADSRLPPERDEEAVSP